MSLLHIHTGDGTVVERLFEEVLLHGVYETLNLVPFLFLTYLLMEFIEHHASDKLNGFMHRAGIFGPIVGGLAGAVPQCGISAASSNLYAARVITMGTLISVFLSASDEMLPVMISGGMEFTDIVIIILYKCIVGVLVGFGVDLVLRLMHKKREEINIDAICDEDNCHCERGIMYSAFHHTMTISAFVLIVTFAINALVTFVGTEDMAALIGRFPVVGHIASSLFGLIPNCAVSVALTKFYTAGMISAGTMMAGLFSGAGVGVLVLFRMNKKIKENFAIVAVLVSAGSIFGLIFDLLASMMLV